MHFNIYIPNEEAMLECGARLSKYIVAPTIVFLRGGLGAGKTTFTRGFLRGLGYVGHVKSPTYTIVESYELDNITVFHFDFYRVKDPLELEYLGIEDYFSKNSICIIEWPDAVLQMLPNPDLIYDFKTEDSGRHISIEAPTITGKNVLGHLPYVE